MNGLPTLRIPMRLVFRHLSRKTRRTRARVVDSTSVIVTYLAPIVLSTASLYAPGFVVPMPTLPA
jgi:hypothetical protein